jgi:alpha 1,2-mannosyltransferase
MPADGSAPPEAFPPLGLSGRRANATLLMLARNSDLDNAVRSVRRLEDRFNRHFNYPWTFLNDVDFDENFKRRISVLTKAPVHYGVIPKEHWVQADWVDEDKASASRQKMVEENVIYGGSLPYRNMCRFNSGVRAASHSRVAPGSPLCSSSSSTRFCSSTAGTGASSACCPLSPFLDHTADTPRRPDVHFHCDIAFDPFLYMDDHNKTYGFTISLYEFERTIPTLWQATKGLRSSARPRVCALTHARADFIKQNPQHVAANNAMSFLSDNGGETYNLCHCARPSSCLRPRPRR